MLRDALADRGLVSLYREVELPLIAILADMEDLGVLIDVEFLDELRRDLTTACARHEAAIHAAAGESFNVNSAAQLRRVLFETLGLTPVKMTSLPAGSVTSTFLRLCVRAPFTTRGLRPRPFGATGASVSGFGTSVRGRSYPEWGEIQPGYTLARKIPWLLAKEEVD